MSFLGGFEELVTVAQGIVVLEGHRCLCEQRKQEWFKNRKKNMYFTGGNLG